MWPYQVSSNRRFDWRMVTKYAMNVTPLRNLDRKDCLPMPGYERYEEYEPSAPEKKSYVGGFLFVLLLAGVIGQGVYSWRLSNRVAELESVVRIQLSSQKELIRGLQDQVSVSNQSFSAMRSEVDQTQDQLGSPQGEVLKTGSVPDPLARPQQESLATEESRESGLQR